MTLASAARAEADVAVACAAASCEAPALSVLLTLGRRPAVVSAATASLPLPGAADTAASSRSACRRRSLKSGSLAASARASARSASVTSVWSNFSNARAKYTHMGR